MADAKLRISAENKTKQAFDEIKRGMRDVEGASNSLRNSLAGIGVGLSLGGLAAFVKSGIDAADELGKLSQKVGVTVESLSALQYAAKLSDVSTEQLSTGLRQLAKNAADTAAGTGDAKDAFEALGIAVTGAGGGLKSTETLLLDVAERFAGIEDGAGKTALAMRIFGKAGAELIPLLNGGRAGFEELRREAERLGIVISTKTAAAAEKFNDDLTRLGAASDRLKFTLADSVLPTLQKFVDELLEGQKIAGGFAEALFLLGTINPFRSLGGNIQSVTKELEELTAARERYTKSNADTSGIDQSIDTLKKRLEFLKFQQRQVALAAGGGDTPGERARMGAAGSGRLAAPGLPGKEKTAKESEFSKAIKQLEQEALKVQELTRFEETLAGIEQGRYGKLSEAQRNRLIELAAAVDLSKEDARIQKEADDAVEATTRKQDERTRSEAERLNNLARQYKDLIDPIEQFRRKLAEVDDLLSRGLLSEDEATAAKFEIEIDIDETNRKINGLRDDIDKTKSAAEELGLTMASALGEVITGGGKASDVMRALAQDIVQIFVRKQVLEPLSAGIGSVLGSIFGGGKALGGPVSGGTPYIVGEQGPELFVPASNGTIVPNNAMGGGVSVVQNISFSANTPAAVRDAVYALAPQLTAAAIAGVRNDRNRTGDRR